MGKVSFKDMTEEELDAFISRVEDAIQYGMTLEGPDLKLLLEAFKAVLFMQEKLSKNDLTILKLKKLLGMVKSSEKLRDLVGKEDSGTDDKKKEKPNKNPTPRPGHGKNSKDDFAKKKTILLPVEGLEKGDSCPECVGGKLYKYQPTEFVRISGNPPMTAEVYVRSRLRCNLCGYIKAAELPEEVKADGAENQRYGYTARSMMAMYKYLSGQPFNRQKSLQSTLGVPVAASTIFDQCELLANDARPVLLALVALAATFSGFQIDDTTNRILGATPVIRKRRGTQTDTLRSGVYTSGLIAKEGRRKIILFRTNIGHAGEFIDEILVKRPPGMAPPNLMSDALASNRPTVRDVIWALCNVHCRRLFFELIGGFDGWPEYFVERYDLIFDIEQEAVRMKIGPNERLQFHKTRSKPIFDEMVAKAHELINTRKVEPNSNLGDAIGYLFNNESGLRKFLEFPGAELHYNEAERVLKLIIMGRKNHQYFRTEAGAAISDVITSLGATAKEAGVNVFDYFNDIQRHSELVRTDPSAWVPWNYERTMMTIAVDKAAG